MGQNREPPKVVSISAYGEELDEHGNEILRIEPMPASPPPVFPDFSKGLFANHPAPTHGPAQTPPPPTEPSAPVAEPEQPKPEAIEPGKPYRGAEAVHHKAQFCNDKFRMVPADELEKLRAQTLLSSGNAKYPFGELKLGEEWKIPPGNAPSSVRAAAVEFGKRHGKRFMMRTTPMGDKTIVRIE